MFFCSIVKTPFFVLQIEKALVLSVKLSLDLNFYTPFSTIYSKVLFRFNRLAAFFLKKSFQTFALLRIPCYLRTPFTKRGLKTFVVNTRSYNTESANKSTIKKEWLIVDAENEIVGRLASKVSFLLRGKHKTSYTPHADCGDNVIIINAEKVRFTGKKTEDKEYIRYTGYPGGQRFATPKELLKRKPTEILHLAIHGMVPKNKLGNRVRTNLFIYAGNTHPHEAQSPKKIDIKKIIA